jgi:hypothetical protein
MAFPDMHYISFQNIYVKSPLTAHSSAVLGTQSKEKPAQTLPELQFFVYTSCIVIEFIPKPFYANPNPRIFPYR